MPVASAFAIEKNIENIITTNNDNDLSEKAGSLFTSLDSSEETFSTYSVYILRQEETVQSIIEKYHISKEELENYICFNGRKLNDRDFLNIIAERQKYVKRTNKNNIINNNPELKKEILE